MREIRSLILLLAIVLFGLNLFAQDAKIAPQITGNISDTVVVRIPNSTHPLIKSAKDNGRASANLPMQRMMLVLKPSDAQEKELRKVIDAQHNPNSEQYHQWLTPEQFGAQFAPAGDDVQKISAWLNGHGFAVEKPSRGGRWIEFSGTASQVESAFHTQIHNYEVKGERHVANATDISIPRAMAPVVAGVLSLHDFRKPAAHVKVAAVQQDASTRKLLAKSPATAKADPKKLDPNVTVSDGYGYAHFLAPGDIARIYNSLPLLNAGIDGSGVSIAIVGRTNIELSDVQSFRNLFSLPQNDPVFITNGPDPGFNGDEIESDLDVQWAGAVAPNATIKFVTSASTTSTDGVDLSAAYIVDNAVAPIMSTSYGLCEAYLGPAGNVFQNALYQQAAAEGISAFVSSGDNGSAGCDNPQWGIPAQSGFMVSGLASTPYATAVGGTEFDEQGASGTYWSSNNNPDYSSAVGYIPEKVWNESCDPSIDPDQCGGYGYSLEAGSGGASNCSDVTWTTDQWGNISYTCNAGYKKPNWQAGTAVPNDSVRDLPDVSMAAAGGHDGYIICSEYAWPFYDLTCQVDNSTHTILNAGVVGGTSAAAPSMAGALALVEHKNGQWAGLANYNFYKLAAADTLADCNSSNLTDPNTPSKCVFHDVTAGTNAVPCAGGSPDCSSSDPAVSGVLNGHAATTGFDLGSGLGSVDISNLSDAWATVTSLPTTTAATAGAATVVHGQPLTVNVTVAPTSGTGKPGGDFDLVTSTGTVFGGTLVDGAFAGGVSNLPGGTYSFTAHYGGDGMFGTSDSAPVSIIVTPEDSTLNLDAYYANFVQRLVPLQGDVVYGTPIVIDARALAKSGIGNASGTVDILLDGTAITTLPLGSNGDTSLIQVDTLVSGGILPGSHTLSARYSGDASFNPSTSNSYPFNIVKVSPPVFVSASAMTVTQGNPITFDILVSSPGGKLPTGTVRLYNADAETGISGTMTLTATPDGAMAHFTTSSLPVGSYSVKAGYNGDANYTPVSYLDHWSNGPYITVNPVSGAMDSVMLTATPAAVTLGGSVNYVVTIKPVKAGGPVPTGTVSLLGQNGAVYSSNPVTLAGGSATFVLPWYYGGNYALYADYSGDSNYTPQQSAMTVTTVNPGTPTIALTTAAGAVLPGAQASFSVTVVGQPSNPNLSYPFGGVQFYDSVNGAAAQPLGVPQYLGVATGYNPILAFPVVLSPGTHVVTAKYLGTQDWAAVTSNSVSVIVTAPDFTVSVDNSTLNIPAGSTGTAHFTVASLLGFSTDVTLACGNGVPAGAACSVTPSTIAGGTSGTAVLTLTTGAPSPQPSASLRRNFGFGIGTTAGLAGLLLMFLPGARRRMKYASLLMLIACFGILVACGGDSKSNSTQPKATLLQLASSNTKAAAGDSVTLTATVDGLASSASGAVTFYDGTTSLGQANTSGNTATLQVNNLSVGAHAISAKYAGDSSNQPSSSSTISQVITGSTQLQVTATAGSVVHTATLTVNVQ